MESSFAAFAERGGVDARYGCTWESTRREDDGSFVLGTSDGEYRAKVLVFAVGMIEPWRPPTPGIEDVPHYVDIAERGIDYLREKQVFIIGKRNSAFEIANGLLAHASQLILGSPHGVRPSITTGFPTAPRARYVQPLEDARFGGGTFVVDVALEKIERTSERLQGPRRRDHRPRQGRLRGRRGDCVHRVRHRPRRPPRSRRGDLLQGPAADADAVLGERLGAGDLLRRRRYAGAGGHAQVRLAEPLGIGRRFSVQRPGPGRATSPPSTSATSRRGRRSTRRAPSTTCSARRPRRRRSGASTRTSPAS